MRRAVVTVGLAAVLMLTACGSKATDDDRITSLINDVAKHPDALCTKYATADLLAQIGGASGCRQLAAKPQSIDKTLKITSISVSGTKATAKVKGDEGKQVISLQKKAGAWKVFFVGADKLDG